ncbi:MAG: carbon-nitrogen hydrolase family protein [candidate division WOR-3 bacterium]|nr:carbon-nitrogen hydrolase family protein [candidate division WOR-3 bacterium]
MKAALISNLASDDFDENQKRILELAGEAADTGTGFILFPEAAATGLANTGDPEHDLKIAEEMPGPRNSQWQEFAKERGVWFAAGLLERDAGRIYDSCVLFDPQGNLALHYRRNDPHWHYSEDNPAIYCEGTDIPVVETGFGRVAMLICGDLWDDDILAKLTAQKPDYLLYPMIRSLDKADDIKKAWVKELPGYCERWAKTGATVLAVNIYEGKSPDASIGGAWFVDSDGKVIGSLPVLQEGTLLVDLPT